MLGALEFDVVLLLELAAMEEARPNGHPERLLESRRGEG